MRYRFLLGVAMLATLAQTANGLQVIPEIEPNDTRATATSAFILTPGAASLTGNSISATTTGLDYFRVFMPTQTLGIYRNRLVITSSIAGHTGTIREFNQTAAPPDTLGGIPWDGVIGTTGTTETAIQTSSTTTTPARFNQWYSFGRATSFIYRVTGAAATTADYSAAWEQTAVTALDLGAFAPGQIAMNWNGQGHTTDTDMAVYDANFNEIPGYNNDDSSFALSGAPIATTSLQSWLSRSYAPGTYYIALSNFQLVTASPSPSDDNFRTGNLFENNDLILNSSTTTGLNMAFTISDVNGTVVVPAGSATKTGAYDVLWYSFTVVPEPSSIGIFLMALPLLLRRRRI